MFFFLVLSSSSRFIISCTVLLLLGLFQYESEVEGDENGVTVAVAIEFRACERAKLRGREDSNAAGALHVNLWGSVCRRPSSERISKRKQSSNQTFDRCYVIVVLQ